MSKKQKNETSAKAPVKLTRAEKKEIQAVIRKYKGDGKPHSAQASIPYEAMYQDGVCRVTPRTFSKCIEFTDISYQLAQADTKTAIFENLCDLYNYLDASIHVQFSFINRKIDPKQYAKSFEIRAQGDDFDDIRSEYSDILQDQLVNGNNGLMKRKFMTYTIEADSLKMARARLRRIETDLLGYFKSMGASAWGLDAKERLEVMHSIFHPDGEPFSFDWKWLAPSGLSTKDFIAPSSFRFGNARMFGLGGKYGAVSFLQILSPELSDEMLADFLNTENGIVVNLHVQAIDQSDAIKTVKRKITDLDAMKIQEQKRAVRSGYDMDILPSDLATYGQDAKELLKTLQSRNERMFQLTFLVLNTADTRQKLENDVFWAAGIAQKYNCSLVRLDYQQEQGLMSSLPLGASHIQIERSLTTSSVAVFVPFVTQELFQGGDAMYYGINAKTGNMIMLDRKRARCPNGLKLGTPGSGKSMSCKSEILSVFLCTPDDVYICDPEAEYYPLVKRLHGQVVKLSPTSKNYVNPLDINLNYSEDENPLALKSDFVLSFCELVMGGKNGLEAIEKTVIDRAVQVIYRPYLADPKPENMPILADLHKALLCMDKMKGLLLQDKLVEYAYRQLSGEKAPTFHKLLFVYAEDTSAEVLRAAMLQKGFDLILVSSIWEAKRRIFEDKEIELILCDLELPDGTAMELFHTLRRVAGMFQMKNPPVRLLPFFILTENNDPATEYEYRHEGVNDYITAPVNIPELIRQVLFFVE